MDERSAGQPSRWHALDVDAVASALEADRERGLEVDEAARRLQDVGPNALPEPATRSLFAVFLRQFKSPLIYLLLAAAGIAAALGETTDAVVIFVVVVINAIIGAVQEGRAERALAALRKLSLHEARVMRGDREVVLPARDVVPGDLILLGAGDAVAADARVVEAAALQVAEAALTGESLPVGKFVESVAADAALADRGDMLHAGTHVTAGRARAIVVATGTDTEIGHIAALAGADHDAKTPLERRIDQFGRYIIVGALGIFLAVVGLGLAQGVAFAEIFMIGVSVLVGVVPEGLPVAMTIALAIGVQRMARRQAVVRRLSAVETLGSTTVICTDKTGTLTRNEMTVTTVALPDPREVSVTGVGYAPEGSFFVDGSETAIASDAALEEILRAAALCNDASLEHGDDAWTAVGDPTEVALLTCAAKAGLEPGELRARFPRQGELPFDADVKMMATAHDTPEGSTVMIKGAPEVVLELCGRARHASGDVDLDDSARESIRAEADAMASRALRVLAVAVVRDADIDPARGFAPFEGRATLLGLLGQIDPPRPEVASAVARCKAAGIRPVVVTGDHKATGLAIARQLGIAGDDDLGVDGVELARMSEAELDGRLDDIRVFARVHPAQKLRIVEAYQRRREVVAMTGDGVNDAPALVRADVGIAMGITGTEVAKDAAKIVLADDDFTTIVAAVEEGRVVYRNIKKAVLLLFSTSISEVLVLLLAMLLGYPPPFVAVQILWNNLVTEGLITINLVMEPAEGDEMQQPPIPPDEPLLSRLLLSRMAVMTPAIVISTLGWFIARSSAGVPVDQVRTETFTLLAICEWFNVLNCRSDHESALRLGLLRNRWLLGGLVAGNLLQIAVVFWAPLGRVFYTVPFGLDVVVALGAVGSLVLWAEEARKLVVRRRLRRLSE